MDKLRLRHEILALIRSAWEDEEALQEIHSFLSGIIDTQVKKDSIPPKYRKAVRELANSLLAGLICYFNPDSLEIEEIPELHIDDPEEFAFMTGENGNSFEMTHTSWERYIQIRPMDSHESYNVMLHFTDEVTDKRLQNTLYEALDRKRPFANFKYIVENSGFSQQWIKFRQKQWESYVWKMIEPNLRLTVE